MQGKNSGFSVFLKSDTFRICSLTLENRHYLIINKFGDSPAICIVASTD